MNNKKIFLPILMALVVASCTPIVNTSSGSSSSDSSSSSSSESIPSSSSEIVSPNGWDNYYLPSSYNPEITYQNLQKQMGTNSIPSVGENVNILVIPIEFTNYPFTDKILTNINIMFNGEPADTKYWESVSSFYEKTSFGKLVMNFTVTPKYETGYTAAEAAALDTETDGTQYFSTNILREAVADYKADNGADSTKQFDSDGDGFIDAVWMIYSCHNYNNDPVIKGISEDFWAYVFWDWQQDGNVDSPNQNAYSWASYDFMAEGGLSSQIDAHTYIHETGHLLGLDDYYNYDASTYKPTGGIDMMDYNITDHNVWSKMALGWVNPYVVTSNAEITINPAESSGDAILIADSWNGTAFDELMMLELYTPTGLNKLDSDSAYNNGAYPQGYTKAGVRLYHVDARLANIKYSEVADDWLFDRYVEPETLPIYDYDYVATAHSNSPSRSADPEFRFIHMIQAGKRNTFKTGSTGKNGDLFTTGKSFSMADYGAEFFKNGTSLNNGNTLGFSIQFVNVTSTSATIRIIDL
ncbi:MAG: hypothetical protein WC344_01415 [Bacilli bacterium]